MIRQLPMLAVALVMVLGESALAHKGSDAYLEVREPIADATNEPVRPGGVALASGDRQAHAGADAGAPGGPDAAARPRHAVRFTLSVALRDLDQLIAIDADADARITWGEVRAAMPQLMALLERSANTAAEMTPTASGAAAPCRLAWRSDGLERRSDGTYLRARADASCPPGQALAFHYTLFREQDATHRLLVGGRIGQVELLTTTSPQQTAPLLLRPALQGAELDRQGDPVAGVSGRWSALGVYFLLGMHHLLQGYDHLAFLLALVLPLQLVLSSRAGVTADGGGRTDWLALVRVVTAFTIGHSITLGLASLGWTEADPAWVEPVIALSIGVTAALNLRPIPRLRVAWLALGFGMVHGYGFAGLLREAAAPDGLLPWALAGFNLGVEAGQLLAVAAWVLLVQLAVRRRWYARVVVRGGSVLLMALATLWFWQRVA